VEPVAADLTNAVDLQRVEHILRTSPLPFCAEPPGYVRGCDDKRLFGASPGATCHGRVTRRPHGIS
jgi:hypothetical protein